jgi:hypothetical protein
MSSNNISIRPGNDGIVEIPGLNISSVLYIKGKKFEDYINELVFEDQLEQGEIDEIRQIIQYLNTSGLTTEWVVGNNNINVELKTAITALETKLTRLDTTGLTASWVVNNDNRNATLKTRIDNNDTSIGTLTTKTKYTTTTNGENSALMGTGAVSPASHIINPSATSGADWNTINLIADSNRSYIRICDDTSVMAGIGGEFRDEIVIHNDTKVRIEGADVSLLGTLVNVGKSSNCDVAFPSVPISQPISLTGLAWDIATATTPSFIIAKLIAQACLPNYTDVFGFKTALVSRDKYITTSKGIVIKDYTLYNLDAANVLPVESTYIAHGDIAKNCVFGNQNYWSGSGAIELRVDDFGNIGSTTLNDKENKTNKIKVSNQNVEIRSNNGSAGNIVLHNGCVNGGIQFRKGIDGTDAVSNTAMEIITPAGAAWHLTSQVIIGADTRTAVAQTEIYQAKSKLIVDTTSFSFTETGKTGIHGIQVSNNKAFGDSGTGVDNTYVDPANVSSKSFTLQNNYTGTTTKTLYINNSDQLMYNGQLVGAGGGNTAGGGIIYLLSGPNSNSTYTAANLTSVLYTMSSTYASRVSTRIRLGNYNAATDYNLFRNRGVIPKGSSNPILSGAYEYAPYLTYTANNHNANFYADTHFFANADPVSSPFNDKLVDKQYEPAVRNGTGTLGVNSVAHTEYIKANFNQFTITFQKVQIISIQYLGTSMTWRCEMVDTDNNIVLHTFPNIVLTSAGGGGSFADLIFNAGSLQTISQPASWTGYRFRFRVTLLSGSTGCTWSQSNAQNINNLAFYIPNDPSATYTTPLSLNTSNRVVVTPSAIPVLYSLTMPITDLEISIFPNPQIETRFYFQQPSGSTNNHTIDVGFFDGTLSHFHTNFNVSTVVAPIGLPDVLFVNSAANTNINMSGNNLLNVGTINATTANLNNYLVKNITAGTNVGISNNAGNFTINVAPTFEQLAFYVGTFVLATGGNTITLPDSIDLDVYSVEIVLEGLLAQSGSSNTFFTIYYNGKFTGRTSWTNQIHGNGEFVAAGDYPQSYNNPVFAYIPQYAGTSAMPAGSIQYFSSVFNVSKHPDTTYSRSPIITNFRTSIGCDSGGSKITSNGAFQYQVGCIQGDTLNSSPNPLPILSTIVIGQYAAPNGPAGSFRSSLSGSPVQMLIYLKKRNVA